MEKQPAPKSPTFSLAAQPSNCIGRHRNNLERLSLSLSLTLSLVSSSLALLCSQKKKDKLISIQMECEPAAQGHHGIANISSLPRSLLLLLLSHDPFSSAPSFPLSIHPSILYPMPTFLATMGTQQLQGPHRCPGTAYIGIALLTD